MRVLLKALRSGPEKLLRQFRFLWPKRVYVAVLGTCVAVAIFVVSYLMGTVLPLLLVALAVWGVRRLVVAKGEKSLDARQKLVRKLGFVGPAMAFKALVFAMSATAASLFSRPLALGTAVTAILVVGGRFLLPRLYTKRFSAKVVSRGFASIDRQAEDVRWFDGTNHKFRVKLGGFARQMDRLDPLIPVALLVAYLSGFSVFAWIPMVVVGLAGFSLGALWLTTFIAVLSSGRYQARETELHLEVQEYAPQVMAYFSAPSATSAYQMTQWLPFLDASDHRVIVVTRERNLVGPLAAATESPVVWINTLKDLDYVLPDSLRVVVYANNGMKNGHMIRHPHLTHIQVLHGESDKTSSVSKSTRAFDVIAVAGLTAVERYAQHGVVVSDDQFAIVGRPAVAGIDVVEEPRPPVSRVLYAPTWEGYQDYNNFSSVLPMGEQIIKQIVKDYPFLQLTVRPHPLTGTREKAAKAKLKKIQSFLKANPPTPLVGDPNKRTHKFQGPKSKMSLVDSFNDADVLITDLCSVPADFLQSGKPAIITNPRGFSDEELDETFRTARGAYRLLPDLSNLGLALSEAAGSDPLRLERVENRISVLGTFEGSALDRFHELLERCFTGSSLDEFKPDAERLRRAQLLDEMKSGPGVDMPENYVGGADPTEPHHLPSNGSSAVSSNGHAASTNGVHSVPLPVASPDREEDRLEDREEDREEAGPPGVAIPGFDGATSWIKVPRNSGLLVPPNA